MITGIFPESQIPDALKQRIARIYQVGKKAIELPHPGIDVKRDEVKGERKPVSKNEKNSRDNYLLRQLQSMTNPFRILGVRRFFFAS
jgi:hypothetical protein